MNNNNYLPRAAFGLCFLFTAAGCTSVSTVEPSPKGSTPRLIESAETESATITVTERNTGQSGEQAKVLIGEAGQGGQDLLQSSTPSGADYSLDGGISGIITEPVTQSVTQPAELSATTTPAAAVPHDLWDRLRAGFSLEYSNPGDPIIRNFESWYSNHPKYFERLADRAYWYLPYVLEQVEKRGMPVEIALLPAIESAFRPDAVSRSNAVGMWQFIAATGSRFGLRKDWWMDERRDLVQSTRAALDYLDFLSSEFDQDWELALAAYNAGEGKIRKEVRKNRAANKPTQYTALDLRRETREYVPKLFAIRNIIDNPEKFNIHLKSIPDRHTLEIVDARTQTDLAVAASLIPVSSDQLRSLNRGYKRGVTPPSGPHNIVVPAQYAAQLVSSLDNLSVQQRLRWARHEVRKGEYLGRIARKFGVSVDSIMQANQLSSNLIKPGQELKIPLSSGYFKYAKASISDVTIEDGDSVYTVRKGDSLWKISRNQGVALAKLLKWNGLSKHDLLFPGQQLIVRKTTS